MTELPISISHSGLTPCQGVSILHLKCEGVYRFGSGGKHEAVEIYHSATQLFHSTAASALLLDYTDLDYQGGDDLMLSFQIDNPDNPSHAKPINQALLAFGGLGIFPGLIVFCCQWVANKLKFQSPRDIAKKL